MDINESDAMRPVSGMLGELTPRGVGEESAVSANVEARYVLEVGAQEVELNDRLGGGVTLDYLGALNCRYCEKSVRKLYGGGYCYDCFVQLARCDLCVVSPERCHFHLGTCREPEWGEAFCMQPHTVYLAQTSDTKIGITRAGRELRRWLDQGAVQALPIISAPSRRAAGAVEAHFKRRLNDRTDWRKLVTGRTSAGDLQALARQLQQALPSFDKLEQDFLPRQEVAELSWLDGGQVQQISYPHISYSPAERLVLSAEQPQIRDNLVGVIGQYLLLSQGVAYMGDYRGVGINVSLGLPHSDAEISASDQLSLF